MKWLEEYWNKGVVHIPGVFQKKELLQLSRAFDQIFQLHLSDFDVTHLSLYKFKHNEKRKLKFVQWASEINHTLNLFRTHPLLMQYITPILGKQLNQVINQLHWKYPSDGTSFQFHQDCTFRKPDHHYTNLFENFVQSAIIIDPSNAENGCIQYYPESHLSRRSILQGGYSDWEANKENEGILQSLGTPVHYEAMPGDIILWNPYVVHGSEENLGTTSRRTYINGYINANNGTHGVPTLCNGRSLPLVPHREIIWDQVQSE